MVVTVMKVSAAIWVFASFLVPALPGAASAACTAAGSEIAIVSAVESRLELRLTDGRVLRLVGVDPALSTPNDPDRAETARKALADRVVDHPMSVRQVSDKPDRWGRLPAVVGLVETDGTVDLATDAIAKGLGRYLAEPAAGPCRDALLKAEAQAREAKLGLWADPYYAVLAVDDQAAFAERSGTIVIAETRLVSVDSGPYRTKLHFAAPGSYGRRLLTASILPHVMKTFEARGVTFKALIGSTLRLRGLLDMRFGPQIELSGPDEVEVIAPAPASNAATTP